ncbi:MAG: hypothetical protein D6724_10935 [Armatimonadetes bacterium]|nr:MAG: hypothetical protein D6724_10935 [Armatimonadota bacterium]
MRKSRNLACAPRGTSRRLKQSKIPEQPKSCRRRKETDMRLRKHFSVLVVAVASSAAYSQLIWLDPINPTQPVIAKAYGQAPGGLPLDWGYGTTPTPITNAQGSARDAGRRRL